MAVDGAGDLYTADYTNSRIVELNQSQTATLNFGSLAVGDTSPQQTVAVQNIGNTPLAFTALAATTNFNLGGNTTTCTSTTSLTAGTTCDLGVEFAPTAAGSLTGTVNITDNSLNAVAPNNVQTISVSGTAAGVAISFSPATVNVSTPGASGTDTITLTPSGGYAGTITLACSGLPSEAACTFNPTSVTFTAGSSAAQTVALTVTTTAATAALRPYTPFGSQSNGNLPMLATAFWFPGLLAAGLRKRKSGKSGVTSHARHRLVLLVLLAGVGMMTACGGSGGSTGGSGGTTPNAGTPKGNATVTVTIAGTGSLSTSATFTLAVQ